MSDKDDKDSKTTAGAAATAPDAAAVTEAPQLDVPSEVVGEHALGPVRLPGKATPLTEQTVPKVGPEKLRVAR